VVALARGLGARKADAQSGNDGNSRGVATDGPREYEGVPAATGCTCLAAGSFFAEAHYGLGAAYAKPGHYARAIPHFRRTVRLQPRNAAAYQALASMYAELGSFDRAVAPFSSLPVGRFGPLPRRAVYNDIGGEWAETAAQRETSRRPSIAA
jgi:tetratricopeptide (TPR) repeat protein